MAKYLYAWVFFEDEAPAIGSGWRDVFVKPGPRLTTVYCPHRQRRKVFTTKKWLSMGLPNKGLRLISDDPAEVLSHLKRLAPQSAFHTELANAIKSKPEPARRRAAVSRRPVQRNRDRNPAAK